MILVSFYLLAFVGFCALAVGLGGVFGQKAKIQNIANLAALAAIHGFVNERGDYAAKQAKALERAQLILSLNSVTGQSGDLELLGNSIEFGSWNCTSAGSPASCSPLYPESFRFIRHSGGETKANAVRLTVKTTASTPVRGILTRMLGRTSFDLDATGYGIVRPRCAAVVVDLSISSVWETHNPSAAAGSRFYAFNWPYASCADPSLNAGATAYCAYTAARNVPDPTILFRTDYPNVEQTWRDSGPVPIRINTTSDSAGDYGPQPFRNMLSAVNGAIRQMNSEAILSDTVSILGCGNGVLTTVGPSENLGYLNQVTDFKKNNPLREWSGGAYAIVSEPSYPNPIDVGLIPVAPESIDVTKTFYEPKNLAACIDRAESLLEGDACPAESDRGIFVLSDGASNTYVPDPSDVCTTTTGSNCDDIYQSMDDLRDRVTLLKNRYHFYSHTELPFLGTFLSDADGSLGNQALRFSVLGKLVSPSSVSWGTLFNFMINDPLKYLPADAIIGYSDMTSREDSGFGYLVAWGHAYLAGKKRGEYLVRCTEATPGSSYENLALKPGTFTHGNQLTSCTVQADYATQWLHDMTAALSPKYQVKGEWRGRGFGL